jgi:ATP-dependent protease ClpP protease subunit
LLSNKVLNAGDFKAPRIKLCGSFDYDLYNCFRTQFDKQTPGGLTIVEVSTLGGDPEVARMIGEDIRFSSECDPARRIVFLGKAAVYSAGVTLMSFFARDNRYVTRGTRLMIHERKLSKQLTVDGPLTTCLAAVEALLNELRCSIAIQNEGFQNLIAESSIKFEEVLEKAPSNWYVEADDAASLGLIGAVI